MKHLHSRTPSLIEPLEARIAPIADLLLKITSIEFPNVAVPGDTGTITMTIENIGDDPATNTTDINIWLVPDPGAGQKPGDSVYNNGNFGWNTAKSMKIVEGDKDVPLNLKPVSEGGGTKIVKKKFTLPDLILGEGTVAPGDLYSTGDPGGPSVFHPFNMTPGLHYIVAEVDGGNENEPIFFSHRNNFAAPAGPFDYQYQFGTVGSRSEVLLHTTSGIFDTTTRTFPGPSADFSLSGGGTGRIDVVNSSADDNLVFTNTSASSFAAALGFKSKSGDDVLVLNNITASGPMKGIKLPNFELTGSVDVSGALGGLELRGIGGSGTHINIGGAASDPPAKIILGRVTNLDLTSGVGLAVLQVIDWNKGGASDTITAPFISDLSTKGDAKAGIAGDFAADLSLNGADAKGRVLGEASFEGKIANATWTATGNGNAGDITADGANQWTLNVAGNVGEVFIAGDLILNKAAPSLTAKSFKEITALGTLGAYIKTTGADSKGVAIGTVKAHSIDGSTIDASTGVIKSVTSGDWINGGNLKAAKIDKLTTTGKNVTTPGDFSASVAVITLAGGFGDLEKATIAGALKTGTWNVANFLEASRVRIG